MVTSGVDAGGGGEPRQAGRLLRRPRVPVARQVRQPRLAHPARRARRARTSRSAPSSARPDPEAWSRRAARAVMSDPVAALTLQPKIIDAICSVYDPEIPVNIWELGLIYDIDIDDERRVHVRMTLTAPACPSAQSLPARGRAEGARGRGRGRRLRRGRLGAGLVHRPDVRRCEAAARDVLITNAPLLVKSVASQQVPSPTTEPSAAVSFRDTAAPALPSHHRLIPAYRGGSAASPWPAACPRGRHEVIATHAARAPRQEGFSLIELLVVLAHRRRSWRRFAVPAATPAAAATGWPATPAASLTT